MALPEICSEISRSGERRRVGCVFFLRQATESHEEAWLAFLTC